MADSNNNQSQNLFSQAFGVAKKLSEVGVNIMHQVNPSPVSKLNETVSSKQVVEGVARQKTILDVEKYDSPQHMLRQHLPKISHQILGKHFKKANGIATFISPDLGDRMTEYVFDWLNEFSSRTTLVEKILEEAGVKDITELKKNIGRSQRLSQALIEQNKIIASVQGALTGVAGLFGSALDIPASLALALRTIYQTGRSHGFELDDGQEQQIVEFVFKEIDLGLIAEKQTILMALQTLKNLCETHDIYQLQQILGSANDIDVVKTWLIDEDGQYKWDWLKLLPSISLVGKLTPIAGGVVSALYSWKLLDDVGQKSQAIFGAARHYLLEHPEEDLSPIEAYYLAESQSQKKMPLLNPLPTPEQQVNNDSGITKIDVLVKQPALIISEERAEKEINDALEQLARENVEPHAVTQQESVLKVELEPQDEVVDLSSENQAQDHPKK